MSNRAQKPLRRKLYIGTCLEHDGTRNDGYFQEWEMKNSMVAPVNWNGQVAELHFWNLGSQYPVNEEASALITHPGFCIRGPAFVILGIETWHRWLIQGDEQTVQNMFDHLGFKGQYHVLPSQFGTERQYFYNDNEEDFVLIKLAI